MSDKTGIKMNDSKDKFLQRMFWYRLQYPIAVVVALLLSFGQLFFTWQRRYSQIEWGLPAAFVLFLALYNTLGLSARRYVKWRMLYIFIVLIFCMSSVGKCR